MAEGKKDQFANFAVISVTETAANTLTFKKLETGISLMDKVAWVINRVEYLVEEFNATVFNATGDFALYGLSVSNSFSNVAVSETTILDYNRSSRIDFGTAANAFFKHEPIVRDYSSMPNGGILVPPVPLYLFAQGESLTAALRVTARLYYTTLSLSVDQYWELVEARRVLSS